MLMLGDKGFEYVRGLLESWAQADVEAAAPLTKRLLALDIGEPFCFFDEVPESFRAAFPLDLDSNAIDLRLADAISRWMRGFAPRSRRTLVVEELIAAYSDGWAIRERTQRGIDHKHFGETLYWTAAQGDDAEAVYAALNTNRRAFDCIGVLSTAPSHTFAGREVTASDLDALRDHAVAVVAGAWDDEGLVIAPVGSSSIRDDLVRTMNGS